MEFRKDTRIKTLPLENIAQAVERFKAFAREHAELSFQLTPIGCGLAGYTPAQIAPLFRDAPANVLQPDEFKAVLESGNDAASAPSAIG
jgi:hypothetical protein